MSRRSVTSYSCRLKCTLRENPYLTHLFVFCQDVVTMKTGSYVDRKVAAHDVIKFKESHYIWLPECKRRQFRPEPICKSLKQAYLRLGMFYTPVARCRWADYHGFVQNPCSTGERGFGALRSWCSNSSYWGYFALSSQFRVTGFAAVAGKCGMLSCWFSPASKIQHACATPSDSPRLAAQPNFISTTIPHNHLTFESSHPNLRLQIRTIQRYHPRTDTVITPFQIIRCFADRFS